MGSAICYCDADISPQKDWQSTCRPTSSYGLRPCMPATASLAVQIHQTAAEEGAIYILPTSCS